MEITRQQQTTRNADEFRNRFSILHQAAVGVILTRSREPFRAIEAYRDFAFAEQLAYKTWTVTSGWSTWDRNNPDAEPISDNQADPFTALKAINGIRPDKSDAFGNGVYVMMFPHHFIPKHPGMMQMIKEYAQQFSDASFGKKRLVILAPLGFTLPIELEDDVVILDFDSPSYAELGDIYDNLIGSIQDTNKKPRFDADAKRRLISLGGGMTSHEYENALARSLVTNRSKLPGVPVDDFAQVLTMVKTEVVKRSEVLEMLSTEKMSDVGGLDNLKEWVELRRHAFGEEAAAFGVDAPKGIALIGPPGTGKSLAAKAIGSLLGLPAIRFDVGRVFNSLIGSSEQRVRAALKMVEAMAPCVLMIDEVDKAFQANSGGGDSGVSQRVLGAILTWMQECQQPVFMIVTANRVNNLPSEFLRRGRLDEVFSVSVPAEKEREDILKIHLRRRKQDATKVDLSLAVEKSAGYVPAEIEAAVKDAVLAAFATKQPINGNMIVDALGNMKPLSVAFAEDFRAMQEWAENNARPANKVAGNSQAPGAPVRSRSRATTAPGRAMDLDG